jgi:uncharacterized membrane protein
MKTPTTIYSIIIFWAIVFLTIKQASKKIITSNKSTPASTNNKYYKYTAFILTTLTIIFYSTINYLAFHSISVFNRDFPSNIQVIWKLSQNLKPITTIFHFHMIENHWTLIYFPLALIYKLFPHPLLIAFITILTFASGALLIYLIAEKKLKNPKLSLALLISLLLNPYVFQGLLLRINSDIFSFFFISLAFYFLIAKENTTKNNLLFIASSLAAMSCKEDISLYFIVIGFWILLSLKRKNLGITTLLISGLYFTFITNLMPNFSIGLRANNFHITYAHLGSSFPEIIKSILTNPSLIIKQIISPTATISLIHLLAPILPLIFFASSTLFLCLLPILVKILSNKTYIIGFTHHHIWHPLFFIYLSAIWGTNNIIKKFKSKPNINKIIVLSVLTASIINLLYWSNFPIYEYGSFYPISHHLPSERSKKKLAALSLVPSTASILADTEFLTYSPNRATMYELNRFNNETIPQILNKIDYCILDSKNLNKDKYLKKNKPALKSQLKQNKFKLIFSEDGIEVFKK